jgi:hypothetical protein
MRYKAKPQRLPIIPTERILNFFDTRTLRIGNGRQPAFAQTYTKAVCIAKALSRYEALLSAIDLPPFSEEELMAVLDLGIISNGISHHNVTISMLDQILEAQGGEPDLVARIRELSKQQRIALLDRAERLFVQRHRQ